MKALNMESKVIGRRGVATIMMAGAMLCGALRVQGQSIQGQAADSQFEPMASATLQGVVRDSEKRPIAGALVSLQAKEQTLTARTDGAGFYRFLAVRPGVYTVHAKADRYRDATVSDFTLGRTESRTIDLILDAVKLSEAPSSSPSLPEFFDEPHFTVAGVTDTTSLGGHGSSDTIMRNRDALAKDTAALRKAPSDKQPDSAAEEQHQRAEADEKSGKPLEAVREYQRAAELNPSEANIFDWGTELLLHRAAEPAVEVFTQGSRLFPHSVRMLTGLGAAWYAQGSYDQAAQRLCEASDLNPSDPEPYLFMGKMEAVENAQSEAVAERLGRFVKLQAENALANYYYAVVLWKQRRSTENVVQLSRIKSLLEKAIQLDPQLGPAYLQLGILYSEQKDLPKAISAYQRAIGATPQLEQAHYRLAQAYRQAGEASKAHAEMQFYEEITKEKAEETARQRRELQQFVYELRERTPVSQQR